jgi:hypothetical protein
MDYFNFSINFIEFPPFIQELDNMVCYNSKPKIFIKIYKLLYYMLVNRLGNFQKLAFLLVHPELKYKINKIKITYLNISWPYIIYILFICL